MHRRPRGDVTGTSSPERQTEGGEWTLRRWLPGVVMTMFVVAFVLAGCSNSPDVASPPAWPGQP
jgi:hypothetical protein